MRRFVSLIGLILASILVGLVVMEVVLRLFGISYPNFTIANEWTGFSLRPGAAGWVNDEGKAYISINSGGMRDREHAIAKPPNTIRIAVLGDSYTEARQVDVEKTYWAVVEQNLKQCPQLQGKKVEVLNFGVSGFGTAQEFLQLRNTVWQYDPDLVILGFTTGNDIRNNSAALEGSKDKPYVTIDDQGRLMVDVSFRNTVSYKWQTSRLFTFEEWFLQHSRVAQLINRVRGVTRNSLDAQVAATKPTAEAGLDDAIYSEPKTPEWNDAWKTTEGLLHAMHLEILAHKVKFLLVVLSNGIQVNPDPAVRQAYAKSLKVPNLFYADRRIALFGGREGITTLTLAETLARTAEDHHVFLHGFGAGEGSGHWNEQGHWEAGQMISTMLCDGGLLQ